MSQGENKAIFIQVEKEKEARIQVALWKKQKVRVLVEEGQLAKLHWWSVSSWDFMGFHFKFCGAKFCLWLLVGRGPCCCEFQDPIGVSCPKLFPYDHVQKQRGFGERMSAPTALHHLSGLFPNFSLSCPILSRTLMFLFYMLPPLCMTSLLYLVSEADLLTPSFHKVLAVNFWKNYSNPFSVYNRWLKRMSLKCSLSITENLIGI